MTKRKFLITETVQGKLYFFECWELGYGSYEPVIRLEKDLGWVNGMCRTKFLSSKGIIELTIHNVLYEP